MPATSCGCGSRPWGGTPDSGACGSLAGAQMGRHIGRLSGTRDALAPCRGLGRPSCARFPAANLVPRPSPPFAFRPPI
ncbi:hypothetical protein CALVIDRAFT_214692 [Calocera viscosa TUFC12733]|uniref:Uncharacterized protein n=1 Tax=Calocera viscosa (strain TUFC12733) TaxID=1330018 RepID=A0A167RET7_CALVF|nr:hypothetical protein CALVIDRAFT_214692 [Calocera viscosa TUFC12733]